MVSWKKRYCESRPESKRSRRHVHVAGNPMMLPKPYRKQQNYNMATSYILDTEVWKRGLAKEARMGKQVTYVLENLVPCRTTFSTASKKSRSVATFLRARIANMPASVATDLSSAPVVFGHRRAMRSNRMSRSTLMLRVA
jgi:hypothetical protein